MVTRLTQTENGLALVFDKALLAWTGIDADTELEVSTDGDVIVISPRRNDSRTGHLRACSPDAHNRYAGAFRRLAE